MAYAGAAAGGAAAAAQEAKRALIGGLLVEVNENTFLNLASQNRDRICVRGEVGTLKKRKVYAFSIDGLVIMTKTDSEIPAPNSIIQARQIKIPSI